MYKISTHNKLRALTCGLFAAKILLLINLWLYFEPSSIEKSLTSDFGRLLSLDTRFVLLISDSVFALTLLVSMAIVLSVITTRRVAFLVYFAGIFFLTLFDHFKDIFQRPRPISDSALVEVIDGSSFPSGHAFAATLLVGMLLLAFRHTYLKSARSRWLSFVIGVLYILLIGWTRMNLQVHYISDVLAGIALAGMTLVLLHFLELSWVNYAKRLKVNSN